MDYDELGIRSQIDGEEDDLLEPGTKKKKAGEEGEVEDAEDDDDLDEEEWDDEDEDKFDGPEDDEKL